VLSITGDHVPFILLVDVTGRVKASPLQISAIGLKLGVILLAFIVTVIISCAVILQMGLEAIAVIIADPLEILGVKEVDKSVGLEKIPSREDQFIVVPKPLTTAVKPGISPLQMTISAIGSIVGAGLTWTVAVAVALAHSPGLGVKV
tara:strand:- start:34 stop:474 length:441 start_codon:yes stop_codon:yes gene_type:complete